jgi:hypothetical protein
MRKQSFCRGTKRENTSLSTGIHRKHTVLLKKISNIQEENTKQINRTILTYLWYPDSSHFPPTELDRIFFYCDVPIRILPVLLPRSITLLRRFKRKSNHSPMIVILCRTLSTFCSRLKSSFITSGLSKLVRRAMRMSLLLRTSLRSSVTWLWMCHMRVSLRSLMP